MNILGSLDISRHMHQRLCQFILHRYLGQFLERNLQLDQLSLSLVDGHFSVEQVALNVYNINEALSTSLIPLKLIDGYIGKITIDVPWMKIMKEATRMRVDELQLTIQPKQFVKLDDKDLMSSMLGSVVESLVSSRELANSFCAEVKDELAQELSEDNGVESFSNLIDAILSRFCIDVNNVTIRFENVPSPDSDMCTALEVRIENASFLDEQMHNCLKDEQNLDAITSQPQGIGKVTNLNKYIILKGVTMYTDVFTRINQDAFEPSSLNSTSQLITSLHLRRENNKKKMEESPPPSSSLNPPNITSDMFTSAMSSTSQSQFASCYSQLPNAEANVGARLFKSMNEPPMLFSDPVKIGELTGDTRILLRIENNAIKQQDDSCSKIKAEMTLKSLLLYLTPSQLHIMRKFVSAISLNRLNAARGGGGEGDETKGAGKQMKDEDYHAISRQLENITSQQEAGRIHGGLGVQGNWRQVVDFQDFEQVNLEDSKPKRKISEPNRDGFKSLKNDSKRESLHLHVDMASIVFYVCHFDVLSQENLQKLNGGYHEAIQQMHTASNCFFDAAKQLRFNMSTPLHTMRREADQVLPKDHLRFLGSNIKFNYEMSRSERSDSLILKLVVAYADALEFLTQQSVPDSDSDMRVSLLDFSEFVNEDHDPQFKFILRHSPDTENKLLYEMYLGDCRTELDLSLIDRISAILCPRSAFDSPSSSTAEAFALPNHGHTGRHSTVPQLNEELFQSAGTIKEQKDEAILNIACNEWKVDLRIPKADLRDPTDPGAKRLPWHERHVHPEYVRLKLKEIKVNVPIASEQTNIAITAEQMEAEFAGIPESADCAGEEKRFLFASKDTKRMIGIDIQLVSRPSRMSASKSTPTEDMSRSTVTLNLVKSRPKMEGPFSQTRKAFSNSHKDAENVILSAGSREEMLSFSQQCTSFCLCNISLKLPVLKLFIPNQPYLELLYNRLVNDLALWQPAAPSLREDPQKHVNIRPLDNFQEMHDYSKPDISTYEGSDIEPLGTSSSSRLPLQQAQTFDRARPHRFTFNLSVQHGTLLMGTVVKETTLPPYGTGFVSVDLSNALLFTCVGYHSDLNHVYFYFTTNKLAIGHLNSQSQMKQSMSQKDFGSYPQAETKVCTLEETDEFHSPYTDDALGVALHLHSRANENVKDVVLAVNVRNTVVRVKPVHDARQLWLTQVAELFTLTDYEIPGYELPRVTNEVHLTLENVVLAYDHTFDETNETIRLRAVLGQCYVNCAIVTDMAAYKTMCILERAKLFISSEQATKPTRQNKDTVRFAKEPQVKREESSPSRHFIQIMDIGLIQIEFILSTIVDSKTRKMPLYELKCRNDIVKIWVCADSLVTLLNIASDLMKPQTKEREETPLKMRGEGGIEEEGQRQMIEASTSTLGPDDAASERGSTWSNPSIALPPSMHMPSDVEQRVQEMMDSAMRERENQQAMNNLQAVEGTEMGIDAVDEFTQGYSSRQEQIRASRIDSSPRISTNSNASSSHNSLSMDDEFCMVDDNVIGSGITNVAGEPRVRYVGSRPLSDDSSHPLSIEPNCFTTPDEWRQDGQLASNQAENSLPLMRFLIKDFSVSLTLYGGSDLASPQAERQLKSYSVEEYNEGRGKGQKIDEAMVGGKHRDHSVAVTVQLNKVNFVRQIFDKDSSYLSTTLFSIADIVVKDQLVLSHIKEMLYQYSKNAVPRRTLAPMLAVRIAETSTSAGKMRISLLPIKINIDQDTLNFLIDFGIELQKKAAASEDLSSALANQPQVEVPVSPLPISSSSSAPNSTPSSTLKKQPVVKIDKVYPDLPQGSLNSLNMEPLTPSPVAPPSPLGDLSYLENRPSSNLSPSVRNPLPDAPLTSSAVSIGGLFAASRASNRETTPPALQQQETIITLSSDSSNSSSPEFTKTTENEEEQKEEQVHAMAGDWESTTEYGNILDELENEGEAAASTSNQTRSTNHHINDDILSRLTMEGSIHPMLVGCLVDTEDDDDGVQPLQNLQNLADIGDGIESQRLTTEDEMTSTMRDSQRREGEEDEIHQHRRQVFFKEFVFSPSTSIFIDYHGKNKISLERGGPWIGLLMGLGQLNQTELVLKEICCQNGLLGIDKCLAFALDEWSRDAYSNVPQVLASIGPINPLVQIGKGFMDLLWLPVAEWRKEDGHPVKGLQKGFSSFGLNSAAGIVGMAQTLVGLVQTVTEAALYEVQPQDSYLNARNRRALTAGRNAPPTDLRHGLQRGYELMTDGIRQTQTDMELAAQEDRASGRSTTRSVVRYAVPAILRPFVLSIQVTNQLLGGLRNQLRPDIYEDERHKWREHEIPGGTRQ